MGILDAIKDKVKTFIEDKKIASKPTFEERNPEFVQELAEIFDDRIRFIAQIGGSASFFCEEMKRSVIEKFYPRRYEDKEEAPKFVVGELAKRLYEKDPATIALFAINAINGICSYYKIHAEDDLERDMHLLNMVIKVSHFAQMLESEEEYTEISDDEKKEVIAFLQDKYDRYLESFECIGLSISLSNWHEDLEGASCYYAYKKLCEDVDDGNYSDRFLMFDRLEASVKKVYKAVCDPTPKTEINFFPEFA